MNNRCKYVMFDDFNPILFHEGLTHESIKNKFENTYDAPTSAGFVQLSVEHLSSEESYPYEKYDKVGVHVYGESVSLRLKSKPEDAGIIRRMFGLEE